MDKLSLLLFRVLCRLQAYGTPKSSGTDGAASPASTDTAEASGSVPKIAAPKKTLWSGWKISGLRYVAVIATKLRGGTVKMRRREGATGAYSTDDPRVTPFPQLKTSRAERLAAFALLLVIALCAFVAVAEDLVDATYLSINLLWHIWVLSCASAAQLSEWLAELARELAGRLTNSTSHIPATIT